MKSLSYYYDARLMCFIESEAILSGLDGAFWLEKKRMWNGSNISFGSFEP